MNTQTTKENKNPEDSFVEHIDMAMLPASGSQSAVAAATAAPPLPPPPLPPPSSSKPNTEKPAKPEGHVARHKRSGRRVRAQQDYWAVIKSVQRTHNTILRDLAEIHYRSWGRGRGWGQGQDRGRGRGRGWGLDRGRGRGDRHS